MLGTSQASGMPPGPPASSQAPGMPPPMGQSGYPQAPAASKQPSRPTGMSPMPGQGQQTQGQNNIAAAFNNGLATKRGGFFVSFYKFKAKESFLN